MPYVTQNNTYIINENKYLCDNVIYIMLHIGLNDNLHEIRK
jgi:hypothetical protein